jgi:hypothetical protein
MPANPSVAWPKPRGFVLVDSTGGATQHQDQRSDQRRSTAHPPRHGEAWSATSMGRALDDRAIDPEDEQ